MKFSDDDMELIRHALWSMAIELRYEYGSPGLEPKILSRMLPPHIVEWVLRDDDEFNA